MATEWREDQLIPMPKPLVSVIVPAYNQEPFLADSLGSVLSQTMEDFECVVVNDGSTDGTMRIASSFDDVRIRIVTRENTGTVADARNAGVAAARGELIAFLDADDWWFPEKLAAQIRAIEREPDLGFVYCGYALADRRLAVKTVVRPPKRTTHLRRQVLVEANGVGFASTALVPASVLRSIGPFNRVLSVSEDIDLADRIAQHHRVAAVDECLVLYRLHGAQGHRRLDRYEHDVRWLLDDRFGPNGSRDRRSWRRGRANLETRLAIYRAQAGEPSRSLQHVAKALRRRPDRVLALPVEAGYRTIRRRLGSRSSIVALQARVDAARSCQLLRFAT